MTGRLAPLLATIALVLLLGTTARAQEGGAGTGKALLFKSPTCGCCAGYAAYLRQHGFQVTEEATGDVAAIKQRLGVPDSLQSCHTTVIDGYVVEGHVPIATLRKLLAERPPVKGIASAGMPSGSPGMPGPKDPNPIHTFSEQGITLYATE